VPREISPAGLRLVAFALAAGGVVVGVAMPLLLFHLGIKIAEIAPGIDLAWVLFPAIATVDWMLAFFFWRKAKPPASRDGPVVG